MPRIGHYPLLTAWAILHNFHLAGRAGVEILDQAISDKTIELSGSIMNEVAYYVGDLLCDESPGWRWNIDAWGLPVLAFDTSEDPGPTVWNVLAFVQRRSTQESPSLREVLDHFGGGPSNRP
jgi:hypothetical protein